MRFIFVILSTFVAHIVYASETLPELEISRVTENVYLHKSYQDVEGYGLVSSNGVVVFDENDAFIVDTPWSNSDTEILVEWIEGQGYKTAGSISTHSHEDRTAGIEWLKRHSIPTYASAHTNEILIAEGREPAEYSFEGTEYSLGDGLLEAFYPGPGHTLDNIVVWLPRSNILVGGCLVRSLNHGIGYIGEASVELWPGSMDKVISKYPDAEIVIPGHGSYRDASLLTHTKSLAETAAKKTGMPPVEQ